MYASEGDLEEVVVADRVIYGSDVKGPVSGKTEIGSGIYALMVMGPTVVVNNLTRLKDITLDEISAYRA